MKRLMPALEYACVGGLLVVFLNCGGDGVSGGTTETGNAVASGVIYNPDGTPAAGAVVRFISVSHNPHPQGLSKRLAVVDSTVTNDSGRYHMDSLAADTINVLASGDSGLSFQDSIIIEPDTLNTIPPGQLKKAGSVRGVIRLGDSDDSRTVIILVFGTNTWAAPDDSIGNFSLANMAEGTYHVRFLTTTPDYSPLDMELQIRAGVDSMLADTIRLPFKGIPVVTGLTLEYDTMKQIVTLRWNRADTGLVQGYNVYRQHVDSGSGKLNGAVIADSVYRDSTAVQDQTYTYQMKAVDRRGNEGLLSMGMGVDVVSSFVIADTVFTAGGHIKAIRFDSKGNYAVVRFVDPFESPAIIERYSESGKFINSWVIPDGVQAGSWAGDFAIDDSDLIHVANERNAILTYDSSGKLISQFAFPGRVSGIALHKDTMYIGDYITSTISAFSINGDILFSWGSYGLDDGRFHGPQCIMCDSAGLVYVTDAVDCPRVQIFTGNGSFIRSFLFAGRVYSKGYVGGKLSINHNPVVSG